MSRTHLYSIVLLALLIAAGGGPAAHAQGIDEGALELDDVPEVTNTHAVTNARVVQAPGEIIENATVVIRDGVITDVGSDVNIPTDALRIDGDTLTVYAGFVMGPSHAGLPPSAGDNGGEDDDDEPENAANPTPEQAGITPAKSVLDQISADHASLDSLREIGFTAALVVPRGGMIPGTGALVHLSGENPQSMVLRSEYALFAQFEGADGVYPATAMGVMARWRQLYREAQRRREVLAAYADAPAGLETPTYHPVHEALFPVIENKRPVVFHTNGPREIFRALALRETLELPMALSGLEGAFLAAEQLREISLPLFLTLGLPTDTVAADTTEEGTLGPAFEPPEADTLDVSRDTARAVTPAPPGTFFLRDFRTISFDDIEDERRNLLARQRLVREEYFATAAALRDADLRFGFSSIGVALKDIRPNLRLMIEHGLSESDALAALTTHPAAILGLADTHGTVEAGKAGHLVITDGPYFDEDTQVRYVFVDGERFVFRNGGEEEGKNGGD